MTIPYMTNCSHSEDGWCLECVSEMGREWQEMRDALRNGRTMAKHKHRITTREFAALCCITPSRLCELLDETPTTPPDFVD